MTAGERPTTPITGHDPEARTHRRASRRRAQRRRRIGGLAVAGLLVVGAGLALTLGGGEIPPGVTIAGTDVSGLSDAEVRARLADRARELRSGTVTLTAQDAPDFRMQVAAASLAGEARIDEALAAARDARGRLGRALARIGFAGGKDVPLAFDLNGSAVTSLIERAQGKLGAPPVAATVAVDGDKIVTTPGTAGRAVDRATLTARLEVLPTTAEIPIHPARPAVDDDDAAAAAELARRLIAKPRQVTLRQVGATLSPSIVRQALRFPTRGATIAVVLDPRALRAALLHHLPVNERPPADAKLVIRGEKVRIVPAVVGRRFDATALGAALVAAPEADSIPAKVTTKQPAFTTAKAKALRITEKVSEFTTPYACCPPRVTNIRRAAQILDGTIIPAGGRFSLNERLGERTTARGFVQAPAIAAGELVDSVGGGVSQVATTTYNAAFFAGLELVRHTPHEFYISRYPMGREATVSWRSPDLVFRNDWPAAILMSVRAGSNGITVAFYSSKLGRRVETTTGTPTNRTEPKTIERKNPDLPAGTRKVIQPSGPAGFTITYTRKVYRGSDLRRDETFRWRYRPENQIVELGPPAPNTPPTTTKPGGTTTTPGGTTTKPGGGATTPTTPGIVPPPPTA